MVGFCSVFPWTVLMTRSRLTRRLVFGIWSMPTTFVEETLEENETPKLLRFGVFKFFVISHEPLEQFLDDWGETSRCGAEYKQHDKRY